MRRHSLAAALAMACGTPPVQAPTPTAPAPAPIAPHTVAACHRAAVPDAKTGVVDHLLAALRTHDLVAVGEHHGDVAQVDLLVELIQRLDRPTLLAMELVPRAARFEDGWAAIVGDRYWPAPLHVEAYARVHTAVTAARARGIDVVWVGLAPDCRLPTEVTDTDRSAAIACFRSRDAAMLDALRTARADHSEHAVLLSAGWRHLAGARLTDGPKTLGTALPAHWSVLRVVLAGTEARETGPTATCGGTPQALAAAAGTPIWLDTTAVDWTLDHCLDTPSSHPLADAFDVIVGLPEGLAPQAMPADFWARVPADDRAAWARTRRVLMDQATPDASPTALATWARGDVASLAEQQAAATTACAPQP